MDKLKKLIKHLEMLSAATVLLVMTSGCISPEFLKQERMVNEGLKGTVSHLNELCSNTVRDNEDLRADNREFAETLQEERYRNSHLSRENSELRQRLAQTEEELARLKEFNRKQGGVIVEPAD